MTSSPTRPQATTVRQTDGRVLVTDGPFAETKEQLGGYYIVECANLDEAIEARGKIPSLAAGGSVEVRPLHRHVSDGSGGRRPPVPARVRACGGDADPCARRLRPRRGGRAGGVRDRAGTLALRRGPRQPRRLDHATARNRAIDRIRRDQRGPGRPKRRSGYASSKHWVTTCTRSATTGSD